MKKLVFVFVSIVLIAGISTFTGCKKENTQPPTVTLIGDAVITTPLNAPFTDPGATAIAEDGTNLEVRVSCTPSFNNDVAGTYTFTYTATDADGNTGQATRTVIVENQAKDFVGSYNATDDGISASWHYGWAETITASPTINNRVFFSKFGFFTNCSPYIDINAAHTSCVLPLQTFSCGEPAETRSFSATGTITQNPLVITLNYTKVTGSPAVTTTGIGVFTLQE